MVTYGRLARVYGKDCVILDPKTSSNIEGAYRHFFLQNGGESRRIEKYSANHMAWVYPPFSVRPVVNTVSFTRCSTLDARSPVLKSCVMRPGVPRR